MQLQKKPEKVQARMELELLTSAIAQLTSLPAGVVNHLGAGQRRAQFCIPC